MLSAWPNLCSENNAVQSRGAGEWAARAATGGSRVDGWLRAGPRRLVVVVVADVVADVVSFRVVAVVVVPIVRPWAATIAPL